MLTATGIGSGLDIEGLVTQLVAAERAPAEDRLNRRESSLTAELSAFGSFKGALANFQTSLADLNVLSTFGQHTATSTNQDIVSVAAGIDVAAGSYDLTVDQLAKSHSLATGSFSSVSDAVGTGTLNIRFGTTDYTPPDPGPESYNSFSVNPERGAAVIAIDSSNNTLEGVRDAINEADIGVSAAIVNDGSGFRLLLRSDQTGEQNSLEIRVDDGGDGNDLDTTGLSALAFSADATNLSQTVAGQNALFTINGLAISSAENTANNVIDGVDIVLKGLSGLTPVTLVIAEDHAGVNEAITGFIDGYNSFIATANSLTAYDAESGTAGALQGDFSTRSIVNQLRQVISSVVEGFDGPFSSLSELGITTQSDGTLSANSEDLEQALENNFGDLIGLFAALGSPSDSNVDYVSSSEATVVGDFAINITQLATRGQLVAGLAAFPMAVDANNDDFTIQVDGISSGALSLTQATYATGEALAAEIQSRINGDSAIATEGRKVLVTYNVDHFEISSDLYGAGSQVEILSVDSNSSSQLGLSVASGTAGLDVAGTIGGVSAIGNGQLLKGATGSDSEGLQLLIGGALTGDRGSVSFSRGITFQINAMIGGFLEIDGMIDSRTDGIESRIEDIGDQKEDLDRKIDAIELRFRARFNALDSLLAQLQGTSTFLSQQLASLPEAGSLINRNN